MTPYKTLKEESTNKNHYDDNYSAPLRDARSPSLLYYTYRLLQPILIVFRFITTPRLDQIVSIVAFVYPPCVDDGWNDTAVDVEAAVGSGPRVHDIFTMFLLAFKLSMRTHNTIGWIRSRKIGNGWIYVFRFCF